MHFTTQDETISQIHQELCDLQSHYQSQLANRDQQLAQKDQELERIKMASRERPTHGLPGSRETSGVAQQLDFGAGGCGFGGEERLKELAAQVEDLTYQLSTTREELEAALERAGHAEVRRSLAIYNYICMYILYLMYVNAMVHVHVCVFPFVCVSIILLSWQGFVQRRGRFGIIYFVIIFPSRRSLTVPNLVIP